MSFKEISEPVLENRGSLVSNDMKLFEVKLKLEHRMYVCKFK